MYTTIIPNPPIGSILLEASELGLHRVIIGHNSTEIENNNLNDYLKMAVDQLSAYFSGILTGFSIPLDLTKLSHFQQKILNVTRLIPFGSVRSYGMLAREIMKPGAAQAVGMVMKKNPLPIIIPCHRVVASDGRLHGYSAAKAC